MATLNTNDMNSGPQPAMKRHFHAKMSGCEHFDDPEAVAHCERRDAIRRAYTEAFLYCAAFTVVVTILAIGAIVGSGCWQ
jgi:hypothetical protein